MNFPRAVWVGSHFDNQIGFPRKIVNNQREYIDLIKKYNNKMNCYTTIYDFERYRYKDGEANIPDETSVILDRAFLDFDSHGNPMSWSFEDMCNVSKYLMSNNYKFDMLFSGKGFHIDYLLEILDRYKLSIIKWWMFVRMLEKNHYLLRMELH